MKTKRKKWWCGVSTLAVCLMFTGCCMNHEWKEATCIEPKTCAECGKTEGEALEHTWVEATCAEPKHCSVCGEQEGEPLKHTWVEATCVEAKHCSVCGEIEGEPLEHMLTEANYQQAAVCEVCGETVGEPLQADFEKYGMACNAELDVMRKLVVNCDVDSSYIATGTITFSDYDIFASDDTHNALEGYEWRAVTITTVFDDDNARNYGVHQGFSFTDYYNVVLLEDEFVVNYNGVDYAEFDLDAETLQHGWEDPGILTYKIRCYFRVPVGYDGIVIYSTSDNGDKEGYVNEIVDENTVFFRLK